MMAITIIRLGRHYYHPSSGNEGWVKIVDVTRNCLVFLTHNFTARKRVKAAPASKIKHKAGLDTVSFCKYVAFYTTNPPLLITNRRLPFGLSSPIFSRREFARAWYTTPFSMLVKGEQQNDSVDCMCYGRPD